jgi:hypothetical protein
MDRRKRTWKNLAEAALVAPTQPAAHSDDVEFVDEIEFNYRKEGRCKVCSAGAARGGLTNGDSVRRRVDALLVQGRTYRDILDEVTPLMVEWPPKRRLSYYSIRNHQRRHLPVDQVVVREIIERRAAERRLQIAVGRGPLLTNAAVFELIRMKGFEAIVRENVTPSVRETLEATRMLEELDEESGRELADLRLILDAVIKLTRQHVSPEQVAAIVSDLKPFDDGNGARPAAGSSDTDRAPNRDPKQRQPDRGTMKDPH